MRLTEAQINSLIDRTRYPRAARYDVQWLVDNQMGSHCLWLIEALCQALPIRAGLRVLDLGCGKALSAVYLAREFGVEVWAADPSISPDENRRRIAQVGVADRVRAIHAEAHALPFADGSFDIVVGINSFQFFATSEYYLPTHLARVLRPGGYIGIVVPGVLEELGDQLPQHLRPLWQDEFYSWHSPAWWRRHWQRSGLVDVRLADALEDGEGVRIFRDFERVMAAAKPPHERLLETDRGRHISFVRVVAQKRGGA